MSGRVFQHDRRATVFGMPLDLVTMDETVQACCRLVASARSAHHVVLNAGKVVLASRNPKLRKIISEADVVNADGQSVVWAGRLLGYRVPERVTGIDLMQRLLAEAASRGWSVYFLGAREEVLRDAVSRLERAHPSLLVAGSHHGYFDDSGSIAAQIRASGARILFVAMPSPMKEYFVASEAPRLGPLLAVGVGGSLDVVSGTVRRAPLWMQRTGLEWFFRLVQEPRKMWRRYLVGNLVFCWLTLRELLRRERRGSSP